ncbi:MAG: alpha/beta fold hydrolase [Dehalococcoidia bacterium]
MVDSTVPLTFAVHSNPGAYAVLLGSGVSIGAGIPTGRQIVADLTAKIALLEGAGAVADPIEWYRSAHGHDPDYSQLLGELAPSPAERSQLLRGYFEPTEADRTQGLRVPGAAHRAMAQLAASGHLRLFLTTNFDRLLERALEDAGVVPTVISTPDALEGAGPLAHSGCTVVKLNGDYRDSRIKNTPSELASYHASFDSLLDDVLADYGLIISGWSAQWDTALREAFLRCRSDRFSTYWTDVGAPGPQAQELIDHRNAAVLQIESADAFFAEVAAGVATLDGDAAAPAAPVVAAPEPPPVEAASAASAPLLETPPIQYALTQSGQSVAYTAFGEGEPLIVVPPAGHLQEQWNQPEWRSLFTSLADGWRVIWFDYPGTGLSEHSKPEWAVDGVIATIDALAAAEGLDQFSLFGMADAGGYALAYAARSPQRVSNLLLYCVDPHRASHGTSRAIALAGLDWDLFLTSMASWWGMTGEGAENLMSVIRRAWPSAERYLGFVTEVREIDFGAMLQDIECPTLVLQTQNQTLREDTAASVLASGIRNAQLITPPGGGMLPLFEAEEPLIKALSEFLG